jgi:hypothetical protein
MLGLKLPSALLQTEDVDIARFTAISVATGDQTPPMLEVLKDFDRSFREAPNAAGHEFATSYTAHGGLRVDFLTPNAGPEVSHPQRLPALQTDAQPLRFLDFLIHTPEQAVVLHKSGIYLLVPAPERYAVHKLIISMRRPVGAAKQAKDLHQAQTLIEALSEKRPEDLRLVWEEAFEKGPKWRTLLLRGMSRLESNSRDLLLKIVNRPRQILPGINLTFTKSAPRYDSRREVVAFAGEALGHTVDCAVSREALEDYFDANDLDRTGRLEVFQKKRSKIEELLRTKYLTWPVDDLGAILLSSSDVETLQQAPQVQQPSTTPSQP